MNQPPWEEIEHTADVSLRVRGATLADLFSNAAHGMLSLVLADERSTVQARQSLKITLQAPDLETLLVDWLSEIVYLIEDETLIVTHVDKLTLNNSGLEAAVSGATDSSQVEMLHHIKAVTYHDLSIEEIAEQGGYQVTIVFDV